jgi:translation initiation factor 1
MTNSSESRNGAGDDDTSFGDIIKDLDRNEVRIVIREETRRFRKPTTIISGLPSERGEIEKVAHDLKRFLATGGSAKDGLVILQGDQREAAKNRLVKMGYAESNIEVQ